ISKYIAPVRALFGDAVENGKLSANPALALKINAKAGREGKAAEGERVKGMTRSELSAVLAAIPEQHRLLFTVLAATGCRISEVLGVDWSDVEFGDIP